VEKKFAKAEINKNPLYKLKPFLQGPVLVQPRAHAFTERVRKKLTGEKPKRTDSRKEDTARFPCALGHRSVFFLRS